MSCLSDPLYALYVAGELAREESRRVEAHLVQCRRCRVLGTEPGGEDLSAGPDGVEVPATEGPRVDVWDLATE